MWMLAKLLIGFIGLLHVYILVLEMFFWDKPLGLKAFANSPEKAAMTKVLAQNQGLYNGFLAAGLFWALTLPHDFLRQVATFFLACVFVAGVFGAITASRKILFIQTLPATIALIVLYAAALVNTPLS